SGDDFLADPGGGEILALQIDRPAGRPDRRDVELLDFPDLRPPVMGRHGPGDSDIDIAQVRGPAPGPEVAPARDRTQPPPGRAQPALPGKITERPRRLAVHHCRGVVPRARDPAV